MNHTMNLYIFLKKSILVHRCLLLVDYTVKIQFKKMKNPIYTTTTTTNNNTTYFGRY